MSHAAIVCREYGLPAVVGTGPGDRRDQDRPVDPRRRIDRRRHDPRRVTASTRPLSELRRSDAAEFGGKSANLGDLIAAGIPVPAGFALGASVYREFVRATGLDGTIASALSRDDDAASKAIGEAMRFAPLPDAVRDELARGYCGARRAAGSRPLERARGGQPRGHVRRPAGELPLGPRHRAALRRRARLLGEPVHAARDRLPPQLGAAEEAMGVTVQEMVDAEVSGVLFTCNPVSGDPSMVAVNASWGLGIAVVGGETTPDDYLVSKVTGEIVRRTVSSKHVEYVPDAAGRGTVRREVPPERRDEPCLDGGAARRARRPRPADRAPLRLAPGRRVGDRPRTERSSSSRPGR